MLLLIIKKYPRTFAYLYGFFNGISTTIFYQKTKKKLSI
jgi:hypothetical protein